MIQETKSLYSSSENYNDDDSSFLFKDPNHPMLNGQSGNGIGRYKRPFVNLVQVHREVGVVVCGVECDGRVRFRV